MKSKVLSPARKGTIPIRVVRAAIKAVMSRGSKAEKVAAGKDLIMRLK
jgi:hypothetical protein